MDEWKDTDQVIYIPLTAVVIVIGLIVLQDVYYRHLREERESANDMVEMQDMCVMREELDEYKKRVDSLTLRAGFKL